jgi:Ca2+-binding EF-hand superfamily protein
LNGDGEIDYNELMRSVVGEMNPIRKDFVKKAFNKLDKDGSSIIDIRDITSVYNAKNHPDVKTGKKTEQEVLSEFLDTFELHHALKNPQDKDRQISLQEFTEYYTNISSTIENDEYFELMITNAWNLNDKFYSKGWGGEI